MNLVAHMNDVHAVLPIFLAQDRGTWVNMISAGGFVATPYAAAYSASKFGLRGFSAALRGEVSKRPHIHICDVCPTFVNKHKTTWRPLAHAACTPDLQVYEAAYLAARTQEADGYPVWGR